MSKKISLGAAISIAAISAAVTVSLTYVYAMDVFNKKVADVNERQAMYIKLSEVDQTVRQDYVGSIDETTLTDGICAGYLAGLSDSDAHYLSAEKYQAYLSSNDSKNIGVGIKTVQDDDGNMEVIEVMPGSPAEAAGIQQGDTIVAIDGKEISRITYSEAVNQLDGTAGTTITFKILSAQSAQDASDSETAPKEVTVTRGEYVQQTVTSALVNGNVAYIKISGFSDDTVSSFSSAVSALTAQGAAGLVIDLRNNGGGSMQAAASVLDILLPAGNTVRSQDKSGNITVEYTSKAGQVMLPVSVIVNGSTYGAAEIFASDIQEFKKGLLVGVKTAGSGAKVQAVPLSDGSAVLLPVANYITVSGQTFTGTGIGVDIQKDLTDDQEKLLERNGLAYEDDPQLQSAVAALIREGAGVEDVPGSDTDSQAADATTYDAEPSGAEDTP